MSDAKGAHLLADVAGKGQDVSMKCPTVRRILKGHFGKIYACHWSSDSKRLVSASQDGKLIIWNAFTTNKEHAISLRSSWVMTTAFCPGGDAASSMVAAGGLDNIVSVYKLTAEKRGMSQDKPLQELAQHEGYISCCRFIDSKQILSSSGDGTCLLWDITRGAATQSFAAHQSDVMSISLNESNNNLFVSGSCDATAKVWDIRQPGKTSAITVTGHESDINSVAWVPDGTAFATGSDDSSCGLFDLRAGSMINKFSSPKLLCGVTSVNFSKSGRVLFAAYDEATAHLWDTVTTTKIHALDNHEERVSCVQVSPDGQAICTASWDTTMKIWA